MKTLSFTFYTSKQKEVDVFLLFLNLMFNNSTMKLYQTDNFNYLLKINLVEINEIAYISLLQVIKHKFK